MPGLKRKKSFPQITAVIFFLFAITFLGIVFAKQSFFASQNKNVLAVQAFAPCSGGGLTTAVYKDYQMLYQNEDFLRVVNSKDLLKEVSQLKDLTCLQYLDATDQTVKGDISDLKNLVNLEVFSLYSNPDVSGDICSLKNATKLRSLKFAFDPKISGDIACLKNLTKLETFAMTHTNIKGDIAVFANMPNLKAIYLSGSYVKGNICSLKNLTNLQELGIADEYPGNPEITGDLSCLNNLKKLKRVSIYNTKTTNCEAFEKSHQGMEKTVTESGKQGGGGCSKESMKTLVDYAQKYEAKIGKEVQTEVRGQPNYNKGTGNFNGGPDKKFSAASFLDMVRNFFAHIPIIGGIFGKPSEGGPLQQSQRGPGDCKSKSECDLFCDKPENRAECLKFAPAVTFNK